MKTIKNFSIVLVLFILVSCYKLLVYGQNPEKLAEDMNYEQGFASFKDEGIRLRYLITKWNVKDNTNNGIIFYFHGLGKNELEWVEEGGFGTIYHDMIINNSHLKSFPVVSITLGATYLFLNDAPAPYKMDMEEFFIQKIIPYFKEKLNCSGKIYLIGHSMGGYNTLTLSLRYPKMFPVITAISPYTAPISPFSDAFDKKGEELNMPKLQTAVLKKLLTNAYKTEENWDQYNPFVLIEKNKTFPYMIFSTAKNDLPGFEWSITNFSNVLEKKEIPHYFCKTEGDHKSVCKNIFLHFLEKISE